MTIKQIDRAVSLYKKGKLNKSQKQLLAVAISENEEASQTALFGAFRTNPVNLALVKHLSIDK